MKTKPIPSIKYLRECLRYVKRTGELTWLVRPRKNFKSVRDFHRWNNRYAKTNFGRVHPGGSIVGYIGGEPFYAHRVVWKLVTGVDPILPPDHKNRKPSDNRWCNLRAATRAQNGANHSLRIDNRSGHAGVHFATLEGNWKAGITVANKRIHLGSFSSKKKAIRARIKAEKLHHKNFVPNVQELKA
jgi:HNH endonuclease